MLTLAAFLSGTYGRAFTAVLLNISEEPNNVSMLWDGYGMNKHSYLTPPGVEAERDASMPGTRTQASMAAKAP